MSVILALETSGSVCSVCLDCDGTRFELTHHVERRHNELLLGMIDEVCEQAGVGRRQLSALAFGCGPGSFTGVRIAAACVQAISFTLKIPVVPVPSSTVLVNAAVRLGLVQHSSETRDLRVSLVTSIRSRAELYYMAGYLLKDSGVEVVIPDELYDSIASLPSELSAQSALFGAPPQWWQGAQWNQVTPTATDVVESALEMLARGESVPSALALPVYVSGDTPWRRQGEN
jgi:tRNA threonylcarbamoyladenosine biosynthesis protein TsaB